MNTLEFNRGLIKIQSVFASEYSDAMRAAISEHCLRWRATSWGKVIEIIISTFKPCQACLLPVISDYRTAYSQMPIESEYVPAPKLSKEDYCSPEEIRAIFKPLLDKLCSKSAFRLRDSHINGVFACEICHRNGCNGGTVEKMKNGCGAYLSKERAEEIEIEKKLRSENLEGGL